MKAAVLADDTTGALEAGALLVEVSPSCEVLLAGFESGADTVALSTESRHHPPSRAARAVRRAARKLLEGGVERFYKKTDSTLRGNITAEFEALLDNIPDRPIVYVPAYPAVGRTVVNGILLVNGRPVAETEFRNDPRNPVTESSILRLVAGRYPVVSCSRPGSLLGGEARVIVCDASSDQDLSEIAADLKKAAKPFLAAGPAAFIRHWARLSTPRAGPAPVVPLATRVLFVCGSLHPVSRRMQIEDALLATPETIDTDAEGVLMRLARTARDQMNVGGFDALAIFGGDTAAVVLRNLGVRSLRPAGEVVPGVPVSLAACRGRPFTLVTKAGGFGDDGTATRISEWLKGDR